MGRRRGPGPGSGASRDACSEGHRHAEEHDARQPLDGGDGDLLDEPLAGLNHIEAARLADTIADINRHGTTIVMIEHNLGEVLRVSERLVVLDNGHKIADGKPGAVMRNPAVRAAYVGKEEQDAAA